VFPEARGKCRRDLDAAPRPRGLEHHARALAVDLLAEGDGRIVEVDVLPLKAEHLGEPSSALGGGLEDQAVALVDCVE